jgi:glycosyltransferase involved in cell wall biosynthesis
VQVDKRIFDLVPLASKLAFRKVSFSMSIIGDGPQADELRRAIASIPAAAKCVRFLGWLPNERVLSLLSEHDVLVLVSEAEGSPIALLEAMALGVVPVVTDLPGHREVVHDGKTGFVVAVGNIDEMVSRIADLALNPGKLRQMSYHAWEAVQRDFSMEVAIARLAELLDLICELPTPDPTSLPKLSVQNRMSKWGIPHFLQGLKRRCLQQELH